MAQVSRVFSISCFGNPGGLIYQYFKDKFV